MLDRVAAALRMDAEEKAYLLALAMPEIQPQAHADSAHLDAIVAGFTIGPAFIFDRFWNVSACNSLANRVYDIERNLEKNIMIRLMLDPEFAALHEDWEGVARRMVGVLHLAYGRATSDVTAIALIERLTAASPQFAKWWDGYRLRDYAPTAVVLVHPTLGRLELLMTIFVATTLTGRWPDMMVMLQPPLNDPTRARLAEDAQLEAPSV
jgi:hypothetical protein